MNAPPVTMPRGKLCRVAMMNFPGHQAPSLLSERSAVHADISARADGSGERLHSSRGKPSRRAGRLSFPGRKAGCL